MSKKTEKRPMNKRILTIPNLLSFFRLLLIPVFIWSYRVKEDRFLATGILLLSGVTDIVDGIIARKFNMVSDFGKVLDPVADKLSQIAMLYCLLSVFPLMMIPLIATIVKGLYMIFSGLLVIKRTGVVDGADWHGKAATVLLDAMVVVHLLWPQIPKVVSNILIAASTIMVLISFAAYAMRNNRELKEAASRK